jgi:hypothetical protein
MTFRRNGNPLFLGVAPILNSEMYPSKVSLMRYGGKIYMML